LNAYWQAYFSYTTTAIAITLMWLLDDLLVNWLGLDSKSLRAWPWKQSQMR